MQFDLQIFYNDLLAILWVVPGTLLMALVVLAGSIIIGALFACMRLFGGPVISRLPTLYVGYVRSIPLLMHLFIFFQLLQRLFPGEQHAQLLMMIIIYCFYVGASQTENIRAALNAVAKGQFEAGYSIGMTRTQTMLRIIFPQALAVATPVFFNTYLATVKGLALVFTVGVVDIFARAKLLAVENFGYIESFAAAALIYWAISVGFTLLFTRAERYFNRSKRGARSVSVAAGSTDFH